VGYLYILMKITINREESFEILAKKIIAEGGSCKSPNLSP